VDKLLQEQGFPWWGRARPTVLLWLAIDRSDEGSGGGFGRRSLIGSDEQPEIQNILLDQAEFRGLPLLLPLWDIEDRSRVRFDDVWEHRLGVLHEASKRYQVQGVLAGRLSQGADHWVGEWTLDSGGEAQRWQTQGKRDEALRMAIDSVVAVLAPRSAKADGSLTVQLRVMDIATLEDYARVANYLARLAAVKQVRAKRVEPNGVTFAIRLYDGSADDLRRAIAQGQVLEREVGATDTMMEYRVRR
jgi:hypothetical protein